MVVLVEPAGELNVGSVARLCANFGVQSLRLVNPQCDHQSEDAQRMAVHGRQMLERAKVHESLLSALADCRRAVATCGRIDHGEIPLQTPDQALSWLLSSGDDLFLCTHGTVTNEFHQNLFSLLQLSFFISASFIVRATPSFYFRTLFRDSEFFLKIPCCTF